jgi:hypothetical protein
MSTPAVPPIESAGLSEPERIIDTFIAPSKTFNDIRRNASWWVPVIILAVATFGASMFVARKIDFRDAVREAMENSPFASQIEKLSPEDRELALEQGVTRAKVVTQISFLLPVIKTILVAAILMGLFNFGYGARLAYKQSLAIVAYSYLPGVLISVFIVLVLLFVDPSTFNLHNPLATNISYFFDPSDARHYWYRLLQKLDIISIWCIVLMAIGYSKNSNVKFGAAFAGIFGTLFFFDLILSLVG